MSVFKAILDMNRAFKDAGVEPPVELILTKQASAKLAGMLAGTFTARNVNSDAEYKFKGIRFSVEPDQSAV